MLCDPASLPVCLPTNLFQLAKNLNLALAGLEGWLGLSGRKATAETASGPGQARLVCSHDSYSFTPASLSCLVSITARCSNGVRPHTLTVILLAVSLVKCCHQFSSCVVRPLYPFILKYFQQNPEFLPIKPVVSRSMSWMTTV